MGSAENTGADFSVSPAEKEDLGAVDSSTPGSSLPFAA